MVWDPITLTPSTFRLGADIYLTIGPFLAYYYSMNVVYTLLCILGVICLVNFAWNIISVLIKKGQPYRQFKYNLYLAERKKFEQLAKDTWYTVVTCTDTEAKNVKLFREKHLDTVMKQFDAKHRP